jgi:hypothetical protein
MLSAHQRQLAVELVTRMFSRGFINTIVGTTALLGEGWDAPSVNTLVMATVIGSYVTSNQMRGRAIRTWSESQLKTANIWHLACVEEESDGGVELQILRRRFAAFVGPGIDGPEISSGLERLRPPEQRLTRDRIDRLNNQMLSSASRRDELRETWSAAFDDSHRWQRLIRELELRPMNQLPALLQRLQGRRGLLGWLRRRYAWRLLSRIATAVVEALWLAEMWSDQPCRDTVEVAVRDEVCHVRSPAASHLEQSRFVATLAQVFDPLSNPRYLLLFRKRYMVVPQSFATNRTKAELFLDVWRRRVGRATLVYTRNLEGKHHLLRAKEAALLNRGEQRTEVRMLWG